MDRHRDPECRNEFGCGSRRTPWQCSSCAEGGYIVEKIIAQRKEETCFEGCITLSGLPAHLCPPLSLCGVEVVQVQPCCMRHEGPSCDVAKRNCHCPSDRPSFPRQALTLTLLCQVEDRCGCQAEAIARIDIELRCADQREALCGMNIRRGAQVFVRSACFCAPCSFQICLDICVQTVISRCELLENKPLCSKPCPTLPLYPPPIKRSCCRKHF